MENKFELITNWMNENGYSMELSSAGYYYCMRGDELIWMDSACEDAYELESATYMAYDVINEE